MGQGVVNPADLFEVRGTRAYLLAPEVAAFLAERGIDVSEDAEGVSIPAGDVPRAIALVGEALGDETRPAKGHDETTACRRCGARLRPGDTVCLACGWVREAYP